MGKRTNKVFVEIIGFECIYMKNLLSKPIRVIRLFKDKFPCWHKYCNNRATYKIYWGVKHTYITYLCTFHYRMLRKMQKENIV